MKREYDRIIEFLRNYQKTSGLKGVVLGISGGKDSTIVAKLCVDAFGKDNVVGILMPNGDQKDIGTSYDVIKELGIHYIYVNIMDIYRDIPQRLVIHARPNWNSFSFNEKTRTNIPPRLRMMYLYAIAQELGYRVAGTGNLSERYIGWCTKFGDMACDFNPIAHLTCNEVIALGDYMGISKSLVHKIPSDGLTNRSDEENFGFSYEQLDSYIRGQHQIPSEIEDKIKLMHERSMHKLKMPITLDDEMWLTKSFNKIENKSLWQRLTSYIQKILK